MKALIPRLQIKDPGLVNLRKAARAVLVIPTLYAIMSWMLGTSSPVGLFAFFAAAVILVIADLGGSLTARAVGYVVMVALGAAIIAVGTLLTETLVGGAVAMFVIVFVAAYVRLYGGYAPVFFGPIALAYSLSVLDPLWTGGMGERVLGWCIGGGVGLVAVLVLWPVNRRSGIRASAAGAAGALAEALTSHADGEAARAALKRADDTLADLRMKMAAPLRPGELMSRDLGLFHLAEDLQHAVDFAREALDCGISDDDATLAAAVARAFGEIQAVLAGERPPVAAAEGIAPLDEARQASRRKEREVVLRATRGGTGDPVDSLRRAFPLLALSHVALWALACAAEATGAGKDVGAVDGLPELADASDRPADLLRRIVDTAVTHFRPSGVTFQNSVRAAAAMTVAVVAAELLPVQHAFWITLGTVFVLRTSAASTSVTALQAVIGTFIGFCVAAVALILFSDNKAVLWTLLPIATFFAAYTPGAVGFVAGQVSFTTLLVVLFTLISPAGLSTDVVRLETVSIGAGTAALMALLLWPRGAHAVLAATVASLYRAAGDGIRFAVTGGSAERRAALHRLSAEQGRAEAVFRTALGERGERIDTPAWLTVLRPPSVVHVMLAALRRELTDQEEERLGAAGNAVRRRQDEVAVALERAAERLDPQHAPGGTTPAALPSAAMTSDATPELNRCLEMGEACDEALAADIAFLVNWDLWLSHLADEIRRAEPSLDLVVSASQPGSWLRWSLPKLRAAAG